MKPEYQVTVHRRYLRKAGSLARRMGRSTEYGYLMAKDGWIGFVGGALVAAPITVDPITTAAPHLASEDDTKTLMKFTRIDEFELAVKPVEFIPPSANDGAIVFNFTAEQWFQIRSMSVFAGKEDVRHYLNHVWLTPKRMEASNGYRAATYLIDAEIWHTWPLVEGQRPIAIPTKVIKEVANKSDPLVLTLKLVGDKYTYHFQSPAIELRGVTCGSLPIAIDKVTPDPVENPILLTAEVIDAIMKCRKMEVVRTTLDEDREIVAGVTGLAGPDDQKEFLVEEFVDPGMEIGFGVENLTSTLLAAPGPIHAHFADDPQGVLMLTSGSWKALVMPMRL